MKKQTSRRHHIRLEALKLRLGNKKFVVGFEIFLMILALCHLYIILGATKEVIASRQIQKYIDFPVYGELQGENLVIGFIYGSEWVDENLKVAAAVNCSYSSCGGAAGSWRFFSGLPCSITEIGSSGLVVENFSTEKVDLRLGNQEFSINSGETKKINLTIGSDYLAGTEQTVELSITNRGTFRTLEGYYENAENLNSAALFLDVWEHYPGLSYHLGTIAVFLVSLIAAFTLLSKAEILQGTRKLFVIFVISGIVFVAAKAFLF